MIRTLWTCKVLAWIGTVIAYALLVVSWFGALDGNRDLTAMTVALAIVCAIVYWINNSIQEGITDNLEWIENQKSDKDVSEQLARAYDQGFEDGYAAAERTKKAHDAQTIEGGQLVPMN